MHMTLRSATLPPVQRSQPLGAQRAALAASQPLAPLIPYEAIQVAGRTRAPACPLEYGEV